MIYIYIMIHINICMYILYLMSAWHVCLENLQNFVAGLVRRVCSATAGAKRAKQQVASSMPSGTERDLPGALILHLYICMYVCIHTYIHAHACLCAYIHVCVCVCVCVCVFIYIYAYIHAYRYRYRYRYIWYVCSIRH